MKSPYFFVVLLLGTAQAKAADLAPKDACEHLREVAQGCSEEKISTTDAGMHPWMMGVKQGWFLQAPMTHFECEFSGGLSADAAVIEKKAVYMQVTKIVDGKPQTARLLLFSQKGDITYSEDPKSRLDKEILYKPGLEGKAEGVIGMRFVMKGPQDNVMETRDVMCPQSGCPKAH